MLNESKLPRIPKVSQQKPENVSSGLFIKCVSGGFIDIIMSLSSIYL